MRNRRGHPESRCGARRPFARPHRSEELRSAIERASQRRPPQGERPAAAAAPPGSIEMGGLGRYVAHRAASVRVDIGSTHSCNRILLCTNIIRTRRGHRARTRPHHPAPPSARRGLAAPLRRSASTTTVAVGDAATSRQIGRCQQTRLSRKIAHHSMKSGRRNGGAARADDQLGTPTNDDRRVVGRAGLPCDVIDHPGSVSWDRSTGRQTRTSYHRSWL
jgi:hypothetical protein